VESAARGGKNAPRI